MLRLSSEDGAVRHEYTGGTTSLQGDYSDYVPNELMSSEYLHFVGIAACENGEESFRPTLEVTPIPDPATFWLIVPGLMIWLKRRAGK